MRLSKLSRTVALLIILVFLSSSCIFAALPVKANFKTIVVPDDFLTISAAVNAASNGDTVFVKKGVYVEQYITIDKPLSLVGEDRENTILEGINNIKYSPPCVILISADNVRVSGFTITKGFLNGIRVETTGSDTQPSGCMITGNIIRNNAGGIITYGGKDITISDNSISNNTDDGIYLSTSQSRVFGNNITENGWLGIIIDSCTQVLVFNNNISGNGNRGDAEEYQGGICIRWYGNFNIYANNITGNNGYGVQFNEGCSNSLVHNNSIKGNLVGVELFNFIITNNSEGIGIGTDSKAFWNNLENRRNAFVMTACPYNITNIVGAIGNGTDVVSWDSGVVGNYWSDYHGQGTYVIEKNNVDHYPLIHQVDISTTEPATGIPLLPVAAVVALVVVVVILVSAGLLVHFKKRKSASQPISA